MECAACAALWLQFSSLPPRCAERLRLSAFGLIYLVLSGGCASAASRRSLSNRASHYPHLWTPPFLKAAHYPQVRVPCFQARQGRQIVAHGAADAVGKPWGSGDLTSQERRRRDRYCGCPMSQRSCAIQTAICRPCQGSKRFWGSHFPRLAVRQAHGPEQRRGASLSVGHNLTALNGPTTMSGPSVKMWVMRSALGGGQRFAGTVC